MSQLQESLALEAAPALGGSCARAGARWWATLGLLIVGWEDPYQVLRRAEPALATFDVPASPGNETLSFLGVRFLDEAVARVRIRSGTGAIGGDEKGGRDLVVMDDFIFGEPTP